MFSLGAIDSKSEPLSVGHQTATANVIYHCGKFSDAEEMQYGNTTESVIGMLSLIFQTIWKPPPYRVKGNKYQDRQEPGRNVAGQRLTSVHYLTEEVGDGLFYRHILALLPTTSIPIHVLGRELQIRPQLGTSKSIPLSLKEMRKFIESFPSRKLSISIKRQKRHSISHDGRKTNDQPPLPFLSLPPEIRNQIYYALFNCGLAIHLFHVRETLYLLRCRQQTPHLDDACCGHSSRVDLCIQALSNTFSEPLQRDTTQKVIRNTQRSILTHLPTAILYTNKQLCNEAAAVLYGELTFEALELKTWLLFARMVSPRHLALVKRLRSTWVGLPCLTMAPVRPGATGYASYEQYTLWDEPWDEFWDIVRSKMDGLVELGFCMNYEGQYLDRSIEANWLKPLLTVRGLRQLEVWVRDRIGGEDGRGGEDEAGAKREGEALMKFLRKIMCQGIRGEVVDGVDAGFYGEAAAGGDVAANGETIN
ncbi:hypothetical protein ACJ73_00410 [Blastomyces percursus]|uniref:DUF7730 domain-containing protein n=1 Tax=Blastomyces percursus TaxID=1658174 RepID=A0A1J9RI20_9EURO|nr:hypothetical protein ACJ73_00410 [Blastomyces percursus]